MRFSPEGSDVQRPSQLVIQFASAVVPVGRMTRSSDEISIKISPPLNCQWRWLNSSALACTLDEQERPRPSTKYRVLIPSAFDSTTDTSLAQESTYEFTTERPSVTNAWISRWTSPSTPLLNIFTNQSVTADSLSQQIHLQDLQGRRYQISIQEVVPDEAESSHDSQHEIPGTRWVAQPKNELPLDTAVRLVITPGLRAQEGSELGTEDRSLLEFATFPAPQFLGVSCTSIRDTSIWIPRQERTTKHQVGSSATLQRCDPLRPIQLMFNTPVLKDPSKNHLRFSPELRTSRPDLDPWQDVHSYSRLVGNHSKGQQYSLTLPYGLKAFTNYAVSGAGNEIKDEFGRTLIHDIQATFSTDHRRPRYVLDNEVSVLEKNSDSKLPVVVNNVGTLSLSYQVVTTSLNQRGLSTRLTPDKAQDISYHYPIDIRHMLQGRSGVVQGILSTTPKTAEGSRWFLSQVTPFSVHIKLGHFNSLAWVTSLETGEPINAATVSVTIDTLTALATTPTELASGTTGDDGTAFLPGIEQLDPKLELLNQWENSKKRLVVRVQKGDDIALVPLSWDMQVYSDAVYPTTHEQLGHIHTWGTTAQGVYKAGDTVQFALWVRNQNGETLTPAPREGYALKVLDPTDTTIFEVPSVTLSEFGGFSGEFTTKANAAAGWYRFVLSSSLTQSQWQPLRVLISDFTPAPFKVLAETSQDRLHIGDSLTVTTQARMHAGGPYADAMSRVNIRIKGAPLSFDNASLEGFIFESDLDKDKEIFEKEEPLDRAGNRLTTTILSEADIASGVVIIESAVRDDRGKFVAHSLRKPFFGRDRYVGVSQGDWILTAGREAVTQTLVVDDTGKIVSGTPIITEWLIEDTKAARVKTAGNVYTTRYEQVFIPVHQCTHTSSSEPTKCAYTPTKPGRYKVRATVRDQAGREHQSSTLRWASGAGEVVWSGSANDELSIIPEKRSYKVGDTARFFIRNPFPGARALLTTERYGVQAHWHQVWKNNSVIVEVPITTEHIPGFFFSATVTSPRVDRAIENQVDLGKPSFKLGYAAIEVVDTAKQLIVGVKPHAERYRPKDRVEVLLSAHDHSNNRSPIQFAVTVLDEAVLDLITDKKSYFDPYRGFYQLDGLDVRNYNLIKLLLGRRNFEKKGAVSAGDGGSTLDLRSLRKFVSYWNPALPADENGQAKISFTAPDTLTGWKIFAIAMTQADRMGLGEGSFTVNREIELRSALPNQVRKGDSFNAVFTVMNRSAISRNLTVEVQTQGDAQAIPVKTSLIAEPFKRYSISTAAVAHQVGQARFTVRAYDTKESDAIAVSVPVVARDALITAATFGSSDGSVVEERVSVPDDIEGTQGTIGAVLSSSLRGGLLGAFTYMREYPYGCWEQRISQAFAAMYAHTLESSLSSSSSWNGAQELVKTTLSSLSSFQTPSGGMSFYSPYDEYANPYLSAYTALVITKLHDAGFVVAANEEHKLVQYLSSLLRNDSFPEYFSAEMRASVRAMIVATLSRRKLATISDLMRLKQSLGAMDLFGKAFYLQAAIELKASNELQISILNQVLAKASESGGQISFSDSNDSLDQRMLGSQARTQCVLLDALVAAAEAPHSSLRAKVETVIPKLARSILQSRGRKEHWENPQENALCIDAITHYSNLYERSSAPSELTVSTSTGPIGSVAFTAATAHSQEISRPLSAEDKGRNQTIKITPASKGRFYYSARLSYVPKNPANKAVNAGIEVSREYSVKRNGSWELLQEPISLQQGELVKADIFLIIPAARNYVVVDDPIPGGLESVNRDLATSSEADATGPATSFASTSRWWSRKNWFDFGSSFWGFYHKELKHNAARFYSEHLPAGHYHLSYTAQAIAAGSFAAPATHVEEMYDPDVFGRSEATTLNVLPAP